MIIFLRSRRAPRSSVRTSRHHACVCRTNHGIMVLITRDPGNVFVSRASSSSAIFRSFGPCGGHIQYAPTTSTTRYAWRLFCLVLRSFYTLSAKRGDLVVLQRRLLFSLFIFSVNAFSRGLEWSNIFIRQPCRLKIARELYFSKLFFSLLSDFFGTLEKLAKNRVKTIKLTLSLSRF